MKNIWDSQGSGHKSSVTYNVQERIIPRNWLLTTFSIKIILMF